MAGAGAGGLYAPWPSDAPAAMTAPGSRDVVRSAWFAKPDGASYEELRAELAAVPADAQVWCRQLVLGPAPEFCVRAAVLPALPWPSSVIEAVAVGVEHGAAD